MANNEMNVLKIGNSEFEIADAAARQDVSQLKEELSDIKTLEIDGYVRNIEVVDGVLTNNAFWDNSNKAVSTSGWSYLTAPCTEGSTYLISGTGSTAGRLYTVLDSNGNIIDIASSAQSVRFDDVPYTAPTGATTIIINAQNAQGSPSVKKETWHFAKKDNAVIGAEISGDVWRIGNGDFQTLVNLHGTANGTFNYTRIDYKGSTFKVAGDDVAPLSLLSVGYVGANHGYIFVYDIVATAHGFLASDIGRTCEIDGDTWVLIKVIDTNTIEVACRNSNAWFGIKRVTNVPASFEFGKTVTVESSQLAQLLPSVKNVTVTVTKNTNETFEVLESYDIIDPSVGIAWIIANVGNATNDSIVEHSDSALTIRNLYQFDKYGACVVTQSVKANKVIGLEFYSGSQSQPFGVSDYYGVPKTSLSSIRDVSGTQYFDRNLWNDSTVPPKVYLQANANSSNMKSMMLSGVEMNDRNDALSSTAGFVYGSSRKMYPFAIQPNKALAIGDVYSFVTYRIPMKLYDKNSTIQFAGWCKIGKKYYVFAWVLIAVKASLLLPSEMQGLQANVIYSEYMTLKNGYVVDALELESRRQGSILVELS